MEEKAFLVSAFDQFERKWALLTAGSMEDCNTMTISWGALGTLWGKPTVTVYVRPERHTYGYMERGELFTLSFFPEAYRKDLALLGTLSGRDGDKVAKTRLTLVAIDGTVSFEQADEILVCRKLYSQDLDFNRMPTEVQSGCYDAAHGGVHRMYIAEVLRVIKKG